MNKAILIGNLTRDPELAETKDGIAVCRFSIAVNRYIRAGESQTDFFNIVAWRGLGENVAKYCKKGQKVAIVGSIQVRNYEDRDGNMRTAIDIIASDVEFISSLNNNTNDRDFTTNDISATNTRNEKKVTLQPIDDDDDIPF